LAVRFAACRVCPEHRDHARRADRQRRSGPELWLLVEWSKREAEPIKYWLAKLRWRIERDCRALKQELGLGHFEGRSGAALPECCSQAAMPTLMTQ
jgi:SRSO17 transposase